MVDVDASTTRFGTWGLRTARTPSQAAPPNPSPSPGHHRGHTRGQFAQKATDNTVGGRQGAEPPGEKAVPPAGHTTDTVRHQNQPEMPFPARALPMHEREHRAQRPASARVRCGAGQTAPTKSRPPPTRSSHHPTLIAVATVPPVVAPTPRGGHRGRPPATAPAFPSPARRVRHRRAPSVPSD